jgi:hypothetical protein
MYTPGPKKGGAGVEVVALSENEYRTAQRLKRDYWLYAVFDCAATPRLGAVQDPVRLGWKPIIKVEYCLLEPPGDHPAGVTLMAKRIHEIRDPIHVFIRLDSEERRVVNSRPFQRLRHIHQLAMTHLLYPGATHRRFEHSLGVMEIATRIYDVVTNPVNLEHDPTAREIVPAPNSHEHLYWKRVVRMAALCHDIGHLPFSHAAEHELLPAGWDHERLTDDPILSPDMAPCGTV